jgi:hypothetical protein
VKIGGKEVPSWAVYGGVGVAVVGGVLWWRNHSASSGTASTATTAPAGSSLIDPATGIPYGRDGRGHRRHGRVQRARLRLPDLGYHRVDAQQRNLVHHERAVGAGRRGGPDRAGLRRAGSRFSHRKVPAVSAAHLRPGHHRPDCGSRVRAAPGRHLRHHRGRRRPAPAPWRRRRSAPWRRRRHPAPWRRRPGQARRPGRRSPHYRRQDRRPAAVGPGARRYRVRGAVQAGRRQRDHRKRAVRHDRASGQLRQSAAGHPLHRADLAVRSG